MSFQNTTTLCKELYMRPSIYISKHLDVSIFVSVEKQAKLIF